MYPTCGNKGSERANGWQRETFNSKPDFGAPAASNNLCFADEPVANGNKSTVPWTSYTWRGLIAPWAQLQPAHAQQ